MLGLFLPMFDSTPLRSSDLLTRARANRPEDASNLTLNSFKLYRSPGERLDVLRNAFSESEPTNLYLKHDS